MITPAGVREIPIADLTRFPGNARRGNVTEIRASVRRLGQYRTIVVRDTGDDLVILAGNHTADALAAEGHERARCEVITCTDDEARRVNLADNRLADMAEDDTQALALLLAALDGDLDGTGYTPHDLDDIADLLGRGDESGSGSGGDPEDRPSLAERFLIPPFDVLDSRQGWWRARKRQWLALGIRSEEGRRRDGDGDGGSALTFEGWARRDPKYYEKKRAAEAMTGQELTTAQFEAEFYQPPENGLAGGTSIFDPVLCELAYRWFSPPDADVLDPFAGGSVRGIVAAALGRRYTGNDLSAAQVKANREQASLFIADGVFQSDAAPVWSAGDSAEWVDTLKPGSADLIFTCPPYYDLEAYGDDPADLSAMSYEAFDRAYEKILTGAARALRPARFAVIVTGDARDKRGHLHDLRGATIRAAATAGLAYYSGAILVTPLGPLPTVAARTFTGTRLLSRTHQDVLVFVKGDRKRATVACGDVDVDLSPELLGTFAGDTPEAA